MICLKRICQSVILTQTFFKDINKNDTQPKICKKTLN